MLPPGVARVTGRSELVSIVASADVAWWAIREGVVSEKAPRARVVMEKLPDEMHRPRLTLRDRHGREPDLPGDPRLVGRDDAGPTRRVAGLAREFVGLPACRVGHDLVARPFED